MGVPNSTVLSSIKTFFLGSFFAKNKSNEVRNIPVPSTRKVCARGSLCGALIVTSTLGFFAFGLGGFLTLTISCSCVIIIPEPL